MSPVTLLLIAAATAATATYLLRFCYRPPSVAGSVVKTAATLCLALAAAQLGAPVWLTLALALGAVGDLLLSRPGERAFLAGLIAFAAAHLAYVVLFTTDGGSALARLATPGHLLCVLLLLSFGAMMVRLLWPATGALRWPVTGYVAIILAMGVAALALPGPSLALPRIAAGLFIASDTILAAELFLLPPAHPARRATPFAVWLLYWSAQASFLAAFVPPVI